MCCALVLPRGVSSSSLFGVGVPAFTSDNGGTGAGIAGNPTSMSTGLSFFGGLCAKGRL